MDLYKFNCVSFGLIGQLKDAELRGVPFDTTYLDDALVPLQLK